MRFSSIDEITKTGFVGFKSKAQLFADCSIIPKVKGVYLIIYQASEQPVFLEIGCGGFFKGRNPNVPISELRARWIPIRLSFTLAKQAEAIVQQRCIQGYCNIWLFGKGKAIGHYGGRYIWQLKNSKDLMVCWKTLPNDEPRIVERQMIAEFKAQFQKSPFANLNS